jgi:hemerythrin-like domain-containing protein
MENEFQCCGIKGNGELKLSHSLQTIKNEHGPLNSQMENLYEISINIGNDSSINNCSQQLLNLKAKVITFFDSLELHSEREEKFLFPMMARYIGHETGPLAVMEYEHEKAKSYIKAFFEKSSNMNSENNGEKAKKIAMLIVEACLLLKCHFEKEEKVLFPLAEQMLSNEEKNELLKKIITI